MRLSLRFASASVLALLMLTSGSALAQQKAPSGQDLARAESLFKQGNDAMKKSQWKEACGAFAASDDIDPSPGTEINLALCSEKQGKLATAYGLYFKAASLADGRGQKDRADLARSEAAKLEPKLHKLVITVKAPPPEGLVVMNDGAQVAQSSFGQDLPIDPGDHTIEATAKNKRPYKQTIHTLGTPGTDRVEVPAFEDDPNAAPKPLVVPPGGEIAPPAEQPGSNTKKIAGFVVGGVGIALAGVAIVIEIVAGSENSKSNDQKAAADAIKPATSGGALTAQQKSDQAAYQASAVTHHDAAKNDQVAAIITGVGALALIGTGVYLVLTAPSGKSASASLAKPMVVPVITRDTAGIGLVGTF